MGNGGGFECDYGGDYASHALEVEDELRAMAGESNPQGENRTSTREERNSRRNGTNDKHEH